MRWFEQESRKDRYRSISSRGSNEKKGVENPFMAFTHLSTDGIILAKEEMGMNRRALWSKIIGIVALIFMFVGFVLIMGGGRRLEYGSLALLGIILAAAGAFLSRSSSRKLVLWGAGVYAATWIPAFAVGVISALKAGEKPVELLA